MKIKNTSDLRAAILELENRKHQDQQKVMEAFQSLKKSVTPLNLVKSMFTEIKGSPGLTGNILNATMGLGVGLLTKKLFIGKSTNLIKKVLGTAVEIGATGLFANNGGNLKSAGIKLIRNIFPPKSK